MSLDVAFIGFGEAARTFAAAAEWQGSATAYDRLTDSDSTRAAQQATYATASVSGATTLADAVSGRPVIISVVTADQALVVAQSAAPHLAAGALYLELNSVAPDTKRIAAIAVEAAGGRYVDVAVMAPVDPAGLNVPLLVSGPHAPAGMAILQQLGFTNVSILAGDIGQASSVKMIRSVLIKGIEALTAEMMLAARAAGVTDAVVASLGTGWGEKISYNLERMTMHGARRASEMEESEKTLIALGIEPVMTRGTIRRQREMAA